MIYVVLFLHTSLELVFHAVVHQTTPMWLIPLLLAIGGQVCIAFDNNIVEGLDLSAASPFQSLREPTWVTNTSDGAALFISDSNGLFVGLSVEADTVVHFKDYACFVARTAEYGKEVYCESGSSDGPIVLKDVWPGGDSINAEPPRLFNFNDTWLIWVAESPDEGEELWGWTGTGAAHLVFGDTRPGTSDANFDSDFVSVDGELLCWAGSTTDLILSEVLCWSGAPGLTGPDHVFDLVPGSSSSQPNSLTVAGPPGNRSLCFGAEIDSAIG